MNPFTSEYQLNTKKRNLTKLRAVVTPDPVCWSQKDAVNLYS
jgi:hypothetical protein